MNNFKHIIFDQIIRLGAFFLVIYLVYVIYAFLKKRTRLNRLINHLLVSTFLLIIFLLGTCFSTKASSILELVSLPFFLSLYLIYRKPSDAEVSRVLEGPQNLGKQLAWWYYKGYLQVILISSQKTKSIQERIAEYERKQGVTLTSKKLVLLLPESCSLSSNFKKEGLEKCNSLPDLMVQRAGTKRIFLNPVYLLNPEFESTNQEPIRCVLEGATCLHTLSNMSLPGRLPYPASLSPELKVKHYNTLCAELEELLSKDPVCKDGCLLVKYKDDENFNLKDHLIKILNEDAKAKS